jgi:hypothetical protein
VYLRRSSRDARKPPPGTQPDASLGWTPSAELRMATASAEAVAAHPARGSGRAGASHECWVQPRGGTL